MQKPEISRRRDLILSLLSTYGELSAQALSDMLKVTVQTIRSDLRVLDDDGVVRRRHGSANLAVPVENICYRPRLAVSRAEKDRIGTVVSRLIPPGANVALGTGTTVEACARAMSRHEGLNIFTNNIHALLALQLAPGVSVSLTGGNVRLRDLDVIGPESISFFAGVRPDFAVYSVGGLSEAGDLLDFNMDEVRARQAIHACAKHRIIVIDQSKIGREARFAHGKLHDAETIVCSIDLPSTITRFTQFAGRQIIRA